MLNVWPFNIKRKKELIKKRKRLIIIGSCLGVGVVGIGTAIGIVLGISPKATYEINVTRVWATGNGVQATAESRLNYDHHLKVLAFTQTHEDGATTGNEVAINFENPIAMAAETEYKRYTKPLVLLNAVNKKNGDTIEGVFDGTIKFGSDIKDEQGNPITDFNFSIEPLQDQTNILPAQMKMYGSFYMYGNPNGNAQKVYTPDSTPANYHVATIDIVFATDNGKKVAEKNIDIVTENFII